MSKIQVAVRIRPEPASAPRCVALTATNGIDLSVNQTKHEFQFDKVFGDRAGQNEVFKTSTQPIIADLLEGYNGCVLTYGQTGAGKTYTMSGPSSDNYEERGLVARTASEIFSRCAQLTDTVTVRLSVLEIYNETLIDLLRPAGTGLSAATTTTAAAAAAAAAAAQPKLTIIEGSSGVSVPALYVLPIASEDEAFNLLLEAYQNRVVAEHQLNRKSSRSHVIYTYYVTRTRSEDDIVQSKLNLVDLAGSERVEKTGTSGVNQKEASYINKSLSFLEQVVLALSQSRREHIPYRQSKLTYILKDSIGGNCATYLIACVWPSQQHEWETLSTLRFTTRMKCIENHPIRNSLVSKEPVSSRLLQQVEQLKRELIMRDTMNQMDPWLPELTRPQRAKTLKQTANIVTERPGGQELSLPVEADLDLKSISQVKLMLGAMRRMVWDACGGDATRVATIVQNTLNISVPNAGQNVPELGMGIGNNMATEIPITNTSPKPPAARNPISARGTGLRGSYDSSQVEAAAEMPPRVSARAPVQPTRMPEDSASNANNFNSSGESVSASSNESPSNRQSITFEEFAAGPGKAHHSSFTDTKEALKANKARQREIVQILNRQKSIIDNCSELLQSKDGGDSEIGETIQTDNNGDASVPISGTRAAEIRMQLDNAKRDYRAAHNELQICKKQANELESLRQRALAALLKAFDDYSKGEMAFNPDQ